MQMTMKYRNICRRMVVLAMMILLSAASAVAQKLYVEQVFRRYGHAKGCKMVEMHDTNLRGYRLDVYKSLTYKEKYRSEIYTILNSDCRQAKKIREVIDDGEIVSGYYMMPSMTEGRNRFILFSNGDGHNGAVIYIEGRLSPDDIMTIVKGPSKSSR